MGRRLRHRLRSPTRVWSSRAAGPERTRRRVRSCRRAPGWTRSTRIPRTGRSLRWPARNSSCGIGHRGSPPTSAWSSQSTGPARRRRLHHSCRRTPNWMRPSRTPRSGRRRKSPRHSCHRLPRLVASQDPVRADRYPLSRPPPTVPHKYVIVPIRIAGDQVRRVRLERHEAAIPGNRGKQGNAVALRAARAHRHPDRHAARGRLVRRHRPRRRRRAHPHRQQGSSGHHRSSPPTSRHDDLTLARIGLQLESPPSL